MYTMFHSWRHFSIPCILLTFLFYGSNSLAGVGDSPLPDYPAKAKHFYTVPGVIKSATQETVFRCTIVKKSAQNPVLAIELFDSNGALLGQGNVDGLIGSTISLATGSVASESNYYFNNLSSFVGSARIISNVRRLLCDAYVTDKINDPPESMRTLPVIKKTRQHGD